MALETCDASVSHDIDGTAQAFADLTLDLYPGENVSNLSNEDLRLIRKMKGGYVLPVNTGSQLLKRFLALCVKRSSTAKSLIFWAK